MIVIDTFEAVIIAILARLITRNGVTYSLKNDKEFIFIMSVGRRTEGQANWSYVHPTMWARDIKCDICATANLGDQACW